MKKLEPTLLEELEDFDTPTIANAIETFNIRLHNEGYTDASISSRITQTKPMVGYAITLQMRTASPPVEGHPYFTKSDWWDFLTLFPSPWIMVIQDLDIPACRGSVAGAIHANIFKRFGARGILTNGAVRDLNHISTLGLSVHSGSVSVSHAYAHIVHFGVPVKIGGLEIQTGDLIHGDLHGSLTIPFEIADKIPSVAKKLLQEEQTIIDLCNSNDFSISKLRQMISKHSEY